MRPMYSPPPLDDALAAIARDRDAGRLAAWSWSTVIDENVGDAVVDRDVFARIHEAGAVEAAFPIGNAGLVHVYGYLFSTVVTPYGYKSDRWNDGVLARSLGLPAGWFQLNDGAETPLERVLDAAMPILEDPPASAREFSWSVGGVEQRAVIARDVLVSGLNDGSRPKLLTIFPIADADSFARELVADPPRLRWNAAEAPLP